MSVNTFPLQVFDFGVSLSARDGTGGGKSQIVRTPLRVKHDSVGKPEWIFFSLKSPIDFTVF